MCKSYKLYRIEDRMIDFSKGRQKALLLYCIVWELTKLVESGSPSLITKPTVQHSYT